MDNFDRDVRISHAMLNGSSFEEIGKVFDITGYEAKKAWHSIAEMVRKPPCDHRNMREVKFFRGDWRYAIHQV